MNPLLRLLQIILEPLIVRVVLAVLNRRELDPEYKAKSDAWFLLSTQENPTEEEELHANRQLKELL